MATDKLLWGNRITDDDPLAVAVISGGSGEPTPKLIGGSVISVLDPLPVAIVAGGGGSGLSTFPTVYVAAADAPAAIKAAIQAAGWFVCTGSSGSRTDHGQLKAAIDALRGTGGRLVLIGQNFYPGATWQIFGDGIGAGGKPILVDGQGAQINGGWSGQGAGDYTVAVTGWNCLIENLTATGTGSKGNGIALGVGVHRGQLAIGSGTRSGSAGNYTLTIVTTAAHGLVVGDPITLDKTKLSGVDSSGWDGTYQVATVPNSTTVTVVKTSGTPDASIDSGEFYKGRTVHNCTIRECRGKSANYALEVGIVGGSSTGDNRFDGFKADSSVVGIMHRGFLNTFYSPYVEGCSSGIVGSNDRQDMRMVLVSPTVNSATSVYIDVQGGHGTEIYAPWMEDGVASADASVAMLRLGSDARECVDCLVTNAFFGPGSDDGTATVPYLIDFHQADGCQVSVGLLSIGADAAAPNRVPGTALVREGPLSTGVNRIGRLKFGPAAAPSTWDPSTKLLNKLGSGKVVIAEAPGPYRSAPQDTIGGRTPAPTDADYVVDFLVVGNRTWWWAKDQDGHLASIAADTPQTHLNGSATLPTGTITVPSNGTNDFPSSGTIYVEDQAVAYTGKTGSTFTGCTGGTGTFGIGAVVSPLNPVSGMKTVMEALGTDGTWFRLLPKTYKLPVFPQGGAADADHVAWAFFRGLRVTGAGREATQVVNLGLGNTEDTEPLSIDDTVHGVIFEDLEVDAFGWPDDNAHDPAASFSSDAFDWDHVSEGIIQRCRTRRSRARGIVMDGKDSNPRAGSYGNRVIDTIVRGRPLIPDVEAIAGGGSMTAQLYTYAYSWVDQDPQGDVLGETMCCDPMSVTLSATGHCVLTNLEPGPQYDAYYGVTKLRIYRRSAAQGWRRVAEIANDGTTTYSDTASDASIAGNAQPPASPASLIPSDGIQVLSGRGHLIQGCLVDGVSGCGIDVITNSNKALPVGMRIADCHVRHSQDHGINWEAATESSVTGCVVSNCGKSGALKSGIRLGASSATGALLRAIAVALNTVFDDQDANSIAGGPTTDYAIRLSNANGGCSYATLTGNHGYGLATGGIIDSAVSTVVGGTNRFPGLSDALTGAGSSDQRVASFEYVIDGGGNAITTGLKGFFEIPFGCVPVAVRLFADQSTTTVIDLWLDTYANYPPTVADTVTASAKPTITASTKSQLTALTGWTTDWPAGSVLGINVDSNNNATRLTVSITVKRA